MTQIKQNQIVPNQKQDVFYPNYSLPRDLVASDNRIWSGQDPNTAFSNLPGEVVEGEPPTSHQPQDGSTSVTPDAPLILSIKSQTVSFKPDGSIAIDVVLVVQDIPNVSEYDIRVAKNAGSL